MTNSSYRGVLKGQTVVVLECAVPLPDGTMVEVTPLNDQAGTPASLLKAMEAEPYVTAEDAAELDKAIALGRRPAAALAPFDDASFGDAEDEPDPH